MANICENHIVIEGPGHLVDQLIKDKNWSPYKDIIFSREDAEMLEIPPRLIPDEELHGNAMDNLKAFGVSRSPFIMNLDIEEADGGKSKALLMDIESDWSPPIQYMEKIKKENPRLHIRHYYMEEVEGFVGIWDNGICRNFEMDEMRKKTGEEHPTLFACIGELDRAVTEVKRTACRKRAKCFCPG